MSKLHKEGGREGGREEGREGCMSECVHVRRGGGLE